MIYVIKVVTSSNQICLTWISWMKRKLDDVQVDSELVNLPEPQKAAIARQRSLQGTSVGESLHPAAKKSKVAHGVSTRLVKLKPKRRTDEFQTRCRANPMVKFTAMLAVWNFLRRKISFMITFPLTATLEEKKLARNYYKELGPVLEVP